MNFTTSERGSCGSNRYWFRRTRTFIATRLIKLGLRFATWAVVVAPWLGHADES
jgi:hypothetical protein